MAKLKPNNVIFTRSVGTAPASYFAPPVSIQAIDSTVAYLRGEDFTDSSSNNLAVTNVNANTSLVTGKFGTGFQFDGNDNVIISNDNGALDFLATGSAYTFDMWIYRTGNWPTHSGLFSMSWGNTAGPALMTNGNNVFYLFGTGSNTGPIVGSISAPALNTWTHVAVMFDGVTAYIYYDGVLQASNNLSSSGTTMPSISLGNRYYSVGTDYPLTNTIIDEFRVSNMCLWIPGENFTPPTAPNEPASPVVSPSPYGAHRYWRLEAVELDPSYSTRLILPEVQMMTSIYSGDVTSTAYAIESSHQNTESGDNAFDGSIGLGGGEFWEPLQPNILGEWIGQDFGEGNEQEIQYVRLYRSGGYALPKFNVQYSDDGTNWTTAWTTGFCVASQWNTFGSESFDQVSFKSTEPGFSIDSVDSFNYAGNSVMLYSGGSKSEPLAAGKHYFEFHITSISSYPMFGLCDSTLVDPGYYDDGQSATYANGGAIYNDASGVPGIGTWTTGDIIQIVYDSNQGEIWYNKNNESWMPNDPALYSGYTHLTPGVAPTIAVYDGTGSGVSLSGDIKYSTNSTYTSPI